MARHCRLAAVEAVVDGTSIVASASVARVHADLAIGLGLAVFASAAQHDQMRPTR